MFAALRDKLRNMWGGGNGGQPQASSDGPPIRTRAAPCGNANGTSIVAGQHWGGLYDHCDDRKHSKGEKLVHKGSDALDIVDNGTEVVKKAGFPGAEQVAEAVHPLQWLGDGFLAQKHSDNANHQDKDQRKRLDAYAPDAPHEAKVGPHFEDVDTPEGAATYRRLIREKNPKETGAMMRKMISLVSSMAGAPAGGVLEAMNLFSDGGLDRGVGNIRNAVMTRLFNGDGDAGNPRPEKPDGTPEKRLSEDEKRLYAPEKKLLEPEKRLRETINNPPVPTVRASDVTLDELGMPPPALHPDYKPRVRVDVDADAPKAEADDGHLRVGPQAPNASRSSQ